MSPPTVILLHGLGAHRHSLLPLARYLRRAGFHPHPIGYPSLRLPLADLAAYVAARLPVGADQLHFVAHSMGGIVLRVLIAQMRPVNLGRVVMLAPPNQGSRLAARLRDRWYFPLVAGPAGRQLADGLPRQLGPVDFELGVIAGTRIVNPLGYLLPRPNDGRLLPAETRVAGMADYQELPIGHALMLYDRRAMAQAAAFLRTGRFDG